MIYFLTLDLFFLKKQLLIKKRCFLWSLNGHFLFNHSFLFLYNNERMCFFMGFIYKIENLKTNEVYIGQTKRSVA